MHHAHSRSGGRRWFLFAGLTAAWCAQGATHYIPYVVAGGGYSTAITVTNTGTSTAEARLTILDHEGRNYAGNVDPGNGIAAAHANPIVLQIAAGASSLVRLALSHDAAIIRGWARVDSVAEGLSTMASTVYASPAGDLLGAFSTMSAQPSVSAVIPVNADKSANRSVGVVVVNPAARRIVVESNFVSSDGAMVVPFGRVQVEAGSQVVVSTFTEPELPSKLLGSLYFTTADSGGLLVAPFSASAASTGPIFTTLPAFGPRSPSPPLGVLFDNVISIATSALEDSSSQAAGPVYLRDPFCTMTSQYTAFPRSYLGQFPLSSPSSRTLPGEIVRAVALKDAWSQHPTLNGCQPRRLIREVFRENLQRLRNLGAQEVQVTTWPYLKDRGRGPELDTSRLEIPPEDFTFIGQEAARAGLSVSLLVNVAGEVSSPTSPDREWYAKYLDSYASFIVSQAQLAQQGGFRAMMLNNRDYNPDNAAYKDLFVEKMLAALEGVRKNFSGKVIFNDNIWRFGPTAQDDVAAVLKKVDEVMLTLVKPWSITDEENRNLTVEMLKEKFIQILRGRGGAYAKHGVPINVMLQIQSHREAMTTGWLEDGFCLAKDGDPCYQRSLPADFSIQAIAYEAAMQAIEETHGRAFQCNMVVSDGYWHSDVMLPQAGMPHLAQSVRNKPAERVLLQWFRRGSPIP